MSLGGEEVRVGFWEEGACVEPGGGGAQWIAPVWGSSAAGQLTLSASSRLPGEARFFPAVCLCWHPGSTSFHTSMPCCFEGPVPSGLTAVAVLELLALALIW